MKRLHILLLLLVIAGGVARWTYQPEPTSVIPTPVVSSLPTTNSGTVATGDVAGTGVVELTGGDTQSGSIDDTELPLDQDPSGTEAQVNDPEVDEIINLLEELISENE